MAGTGLWMNHYRVQLVRYSVACGEQCGIDAKFQYVFHVGNNGYADRSWRMFALGSTILLVENGWKEWYFSLLEPYVHYIPIKHDASDACEKLAWARANPAKAKAIADRGRAFVEQCMTLDLVNLYCAE